MKHHTMKQAIAIVFLFLSFTGYAQLQKFLIEGQVVDSQGDPISDVYIVNLNSQEKDISVSNGIFSIWANPSDSIVLSHISYFRKVVTIHKLLINPKVVLVSENVDIEEITVTPDQLSDEDRAQMNMSFIADYNPPVRMRLAEGESDPVSSIAIENNDQMRVEASSISIIRFSPSDNIGKLFTKLKKKDRTNDYSSSRKQKSELTEKNQ